MRKGQCPCGATVIETVEITTTDGQHIAQCAVCRTHVTVS